MAERLREGGHEVSRKRAQRPKRRARLWPRRSKIRPDPARRRDPPSVPTTIMLAWRMMVGKPLEFFFEGMPVGVFEEQYPIVPGRYRYMPYR